LAVIASVAILGNTQSLSSAQSKRDMPRDWSAQPYITAGLVFAIVLLTIFGLAPSKRQTILEKIGEHYPVGAADYIRYYHLPHPLFNAYQWGGFLTWYLPEYPVAIDNRTELYVADFNIQYAKAMTAEVHYSTFAPLNQAGTIVLEKESLMGKALPSVPGFGVAYVDNVAIVLIRGEERP
jgi:hypothetical protein